MLCLALPWLAHSADEATEIRVLLARGAAPEALQRVERALAADPKNAQLRFMHGVVLMDLARDAEALALFTRLSQDYPELPDPLNNIALLQVRAGQLDSALVALQAALRNDPTHRTARANLGQVYLMLAVQAWTQLAGSGPLDPPLQRRLEAARALLSSPAPAAR
jgi:Tfp pilus assembly protein PilF